jgi:hypothetical protein
MLTVSTIDENVALTKPVIEWEIMYNKRPELQLLLQSERNLKTQFQSNLPKVFCASMSKHAEQFIPNFYMLGAKAHWNVFDWDKSKREALLHEAINYRKRNFLTQYQSSIKGNGK